MRSSNIWRSRPVFITSTFRDMHAERDWLRVHVFPVLEERLRDRLHHLETVDLRWGVDSTSTEEEESREHLVLTVCFDEIRRSRPFMIGLLGDRYGWTPPANQLGAAAQEAGLRGEIAGKSVTELEIIHGVLANPDQQRRSWFYIRDPLPYDTMPRDVAARFSAAHSTAADAADNVAKLVALKERLRREIPTRVRSYAAHWNANAASVDGLEGWGEQVLEDVWSDLEVETEAFLREAPSTWQAQDRWALEEFIEGRVRGFVGRTSIANELIHFATADLTEEGPWGFCLTAEAGGGKSSVFGHVYRSLQEQGALVLAHAAGISVRSTQVDWMLRRWVGELAVVLGQADPLDDASSPDEIGLAFSRLLDQTAGLRRVIVLTDALNQFEPTTRATHLTWVPRSWPRNARLIATAIPGKQSEALLQRAGVLPKPLPAIEQGEALSIVRRICERYHRTLSADVADALLAKSRDDTSPAFGNPLWLELATEQLNLLGGSTFALLDASAGAAGIVSLLLSQVSAMPSTIAELYGWLLRDTEQHIGRAWTCAFVNAIAVSRGGWRESDLRVVMEALSGEPWDDLRFAALRRAFRAHVVQRGANAQWEFAHAQLRQAAVARMAAESYDAAPVHDVIGDHLLGVRHEDPLHEAETMYHLMKGTSHVRAAEYYAGERTLGESEGATRTLAAMVAGGEVAEVTALLGMLEGAEPLSRLCHRFVFELFNAIQGNARLADCEMVLLAAANGFAVLLARERAHPRWRREKAVTHSKLGEVLVAHGRHQEALEAYQSALAILQGLETQHPDDARWRSDISATRFKIGNVLLQRGAVGDATRAFNDAALAKAEAHIAHVPPPTEFMFDGIITLIGQGDASIAQGRTAEAMDWYQKGVETTRQWLEWYQALVAKKHAWGEQEARSVEVAGYHAICRARLARTHFLTGDHARALTEQEEAHAVFQQLASDDPANTKLLLDLSLSNVARGQWRCAAGDTAGAAQDYDAALAITDRLMRADPLNHEWLNAANACQTLYAELRRAQGDYAGALTLFEQAVSSARRLLTVNADAVESRHRLVQSLVAQGEIRDRTGDFERAHVAYEAVLESAAAGAALQPAEQSWQRYISGAHHAMGTVLVKRRRPFLAIERFQMCIHTANELKSQGVDDADCMEAFARSYAAISQILMGLKDLAGAHAARQLSRAPSVVELQSLLLDAYDRLAVALRDAPAELTELVGLSDVVAIGSAAQTLCEQVVKGRPSDTYWRLRLLLLHQSLGELLQTSGDSAGVLGAFEKSLVLADGLVRDEPSQPKWRGALVVCLLDIADAQSMVGNESDALVSLSRCRDTLQEMQNGGSSFGSETAELLQLLNDRLGMDKFP